MFKNNLNPPPPKKVPHKCSNQIQQWYSPRCNNERNQLESWFSFLKPILEAFKIINILKII